RGGLSSMRRFLLYVHTGRRAALQATLSVLEELRVRNVRAVMVDDQVDEILALPEDMAPPKLLTFLTNGVVDVVDAVSAGDLVELGSVLGGDGTILRALEAVRAADVPVHGVNLGHVGFLAESEVEDLSITVSRLLGGDYEREERSTLELSVLVDEDQLQDRHRARDEADMAEDDYRYQSLVDCYNDIISDDT